MRYEQGLFSLLILLERITQTQVQQTFCRDAFDIGYINMNGSILTFDIVLNLLLI